MKKVIVIDERDNSIKVDEYPEGINEIAESMNRFWREHGFDV